MLDSRDFDLCSCWDLEEANRLRFASEMGCESARTAEEFLRKEALDAVALFTPNHLHAEQAILALEHGLHVFVEKPMANTVADAARMVECANRMDRVLFVGHNTRREGRFRRIREMLGAGVIGLPVMANMTFTSPAGLKKELGGWRYDKSLCPAVALSQIGIHAIDVLHFLFGKTVETEAWIGKVGLEFDVEDVCLARMEHPSGMSSLLQTAYSVPRVRSLQVLGTGGKIETFQEGEILLHPMGETEVERREVAPLVDTVFEEFQEFAACCRGLQQPETDGTVGLEAVAAMEAMIESSRNRQPVRL
jgi:predicted dehydrogenase